MAEYIEREAAFNAILKLIPKVDDDGYCWVIRGDAATAIDSIPAADVVERKKGTWIETYGKYGNFRHQCSECGELFSVPFDFKGKYYPFNFCPNCRADMRGENDV